MQFLKRKKMIGVPRLALLVGVTVWISLSGTKVAMSTPRKLAAPSCPPHHYCMKEVGINGGCTPRDCCLPTDTFCGKTMTPGDVPKLKPASSGYCYRDGTEDDGLDMVTTCRIAGCENLCAGTCTIGPQQIATSFPPVRGQKCPPPPGDPR